jgi:hypothetical protein
MDGTWPSGSAAKAAANRERQLEELHAIAAIYAAEFAAPDPVVLAAHLENFGAATQPSCRAHRTLSGPRTTPAH